MPSVRGFRRTVSVAFYLFTKRIFDVTVALLMLLTHLPRFLSGRLFPGEETLTVDGRRRCLCVGGDGQLFPLWREERLTAPVARLEEHAGRPGSFCPAGVLFAILCGHMSFVGVSLRCATETFGRYAYAPSAKPGVFGLYRLLPAAKKDPAAVAGSDRLYVACRGIRTDWYLFRLFLRAYESRRHYTS